MILAVALVLLDDPVAIVARRCHDCHDARKAKGGLRLDDLDALRRVASSGQLARAIGWTDPELRMPPKQKLPAEELAALEAWLARGAPLPPTPWELRKKWLFTPPADVKATSIDELLDAKLRERELSTSPPADRRTLLRRVSFDLTGLPPGPDDGAPYEEVVERLLASPAYGERWGRHWLDLARYATVREDQAAARKEPSEIAEAWKYRDWVVDAFNRDLPYDRFVERQVAGDLLGHPVAAGFLAIGEWGIQNDHPEKMVWDTADEQIDAVGRTFLGLTLACARCHDHKFDPVSTRDYYALAGIFISSRVVAKPARIGKHTPMLRVGDVLSAADGGIPGTSYEGVQDARVRVRGDVQRVGELVPRGVPEVFEASMSIAAGSGRRELAAWLASPTNPLTARVWVNRVWRQHFGEGLVRTPSNFGKLGEAPTHPELLDWLARRFVEDGWSVKALHRRILLSAAYRRSSVPTPDALAKDPENRWLSRMNRRRLEAEAIRDSLLAVAGLLDRRAGGAADVESKRRMIYQRVSRTSAAPFEALFDGADATAHTDRRNVSTVAPQALFLLNHPFVGEVAAALADTPAELLFERVYARAPSPEELEDARALSGAERARALLMSNEFVTVD